MTDQIEAILFDMGGTLRSSDKNSLSVKQERVSRIMRIIGADGSPEQFTELLSTRAKAYMRWARETLLELNEFDLWTKWMLPDWPGEKIGGIAVQLNQLWREGTGTRRIFPETKEVVLELFRRGYRLGIVSNTVSSVEVPQALRDMEISGCFELVVLSCQVGTRKPGPAIMLEAAHRMGIQPEKCVYIGDRYDRDVSSSRNAGFSQAIIIHNSGMIVEEPPEDPALIPDRTIHNLKQLLEIFPPRRDKKNTQAVYNASLSTMWARKNFPALPDFFEAGRRLGFARIELNHQINTAMLAGIDLRRYQFSSVHEPCPADISTEELKKRDWLISSPDEDCRKQGVESIRHSIDLARELGIGTIVVHSGMASSDMTLEKKLRDLFGAGKTGTEEYQKMKQNLIESRAGLIGPRIEAVKKSLMELLDYASHYRIRLGLENRYHYFDIPTPDEMGILLSLAGPNHLGFILDVGHAQAMDRLGFFPLEGWLKRFASRIIGVHLHDVKGIDDHFAPGLGEVDFDLVSRYLPDNAFRTLEVQTSNTSEQVRDGLRFLAQHGCINTI